MNNLELMSTTKELVKKERAYTLQILKQLEEIDRRRCYCELGYSSLFQYCVKELKYSEAEATVRVNAARLIRSTPTAAPKIQSGEITLIAASMIQSFSKKENLNKEEKLQLIEEAQSKSKREVEVILRDRSRAPESKKIKIEISEKTYEKLAKLQAITGGDLDKLIETLVDNKLEELKPQRQTTKTESMTRYIPVKVKREVNARSQNRCEYISPITGKRCDAIHYLHYDHIKAFSKNGTATTQNIQRLCSTHNLYKGDNRFNLC